MYATVRILRNIIYAASAKGGNLAHLCSAAGLLPSDLKDADKIVEGVAPVIRLWTEILSSTGDEHFGLHIGEQSNPSGLGLLGYLMQSCPTVKDMLTELHKHQEVVSGWVSYRLESGKESEVIFSINPLWLRTSPETARQALDMALGGSLITLTILTGQKIWPLRVELSHNRIASKSEYERVFRCPVSFGKEKTTLFFPKTFEGIPLMAYDESLYITFGKLLKEKSMALGLEDNFGKQVRQVIIRDFQGQIPALEIIAAHMNVSERSFQRRLQAEKENYRSIGNTIKKELAFNLLKNTDATVYAISEVLGYTEPSAFHRAFKNWTKTTPFQKKHTPD